MNSLFILLAKYNSPRMNLDQIADFMNLDPATVQNRIYARRMPFPVYKEGSGHFADINDVAAYLQEMRNSAKAAHEAMKKSLD